MRSGSAASPAEAAGASADGPAATHGPGRATTTSTPPSTPYSRVAYSEILPAEDAECCVGFLERADAWFSMHGITIERVLTDNGKGYISHAWRDLCADLDVTHTPHPPLHAPHQRQSRTLQPHPRRRMGLRARLPVEHGTRPRRSTDGSTPTITTAHTPRSEATHP